MKITQEIELEPLRVPNYVIQVVPPGRRQDGFKEAPKFHVGELDDATLNKLCAQFRDDLFAKAEKWRQESSKGTGT